MYPVDTHYRPPRTGDRLEATVARTIREALHRDTGDILVFLPGAAEQRRVASALQGDTELQAAHAVVHTLHGSMTLAAQDAALASAPRGTRKVVLATSIAETSLTIDGVRVVIDSGFSRLPRYEARAGMTRLDTVRVSRASANQRRGRAGRTAPGVCYRLWDQHEEFGFQANTRPEILDADLASLALELADAGISDPGTLRWLDVPKAGAFAGARNLLAQLGALDRGGRITLHGKRMAALPLAPRLGHMLLIAADREQTRLGAEIAALLEERDVLRGAGAAFRDVPVDMTLRVDGIRGQAIGGGLSIDRDVAARVRQNAGELQRRIGAAGAPQRAGDRRDSHVTGALLALAFPDRIARRRSTGTPRYLLRNGTGATLERHDALADSEWLAIAELDGSAPDYRIARAAALTYEDVMRDFDEDIVRDTVVEWHEPTRAVRATRRTSLGAIVIDDVVVQQADATLVRAVLLEQVAHDGVDALPWPAGALSLRARLAFLHAHDTSWPDVSSVALTASLGTWLGDRLDGMRKWSDLVRIDWHDALLALLPWDRRAALERLAPTHLEVPSGSRVALDYRDPASPVLAVRLQEVFGWAATPLLMDGRVPIMLHLLSPAQRPVQVTRDLAGFWRSSYFEVRKELRGRYPRHSWPDDPLSATATRRAKPRGT